jgi:glutaredoxin
MMIGEPICSAKELERRRAGAARLGELRRDGANAKSEGRIASAANVAAPVMVYFEKDRNTRLLERIKELLDARGIAFTLLDVAGDSGTKDFVMREAHCKEDELPIVFVASAPVGGYNDLVEWDVSGKLTKAVYPS